MKTSPERGITISNEKIRRIIALLLITAMICTFVPYFGNSFAYASDISDEIAEKEALLEKAKKNLDAARDRYDKERAEALEDIEVTDEELKLVGRQFIEELVTSSYEEDKKDGVDDLVPLTKLTIKGHITKAKNNSTCSSIISSIGSKAFERSINNSLSIDNLNKAIDYIEECNSLRKKHDLSPLRVSPYLMAGAAVSNALSGRSAHVYVRQGLFKTYDSTNVYENFCWAYSTSYDPFNGWYNSEKENKGEHFRAITNSDYKQTGFSYNDSNYDSKMTAAQAFTKDNGGESYTASGFRKLLNDYVEEKKREIREEKGGDLLYQEGDPDYVIKAEEKYDNAYEALKDVIKGYKATFSIKRYNYHTIKIGYSIPDGFDGVRIYRSKTGKSGSYIRIAQLTSGTSYKDGDLVCGNKYYYKVRFYKKVGSVKVNSAFSIVRYLTARPTQVKDLTAVKKTSTKLELTWRKTVGAHKYQIFVKRPADSSFVMLKEDKVVRNIKLMGRNNLSTSAVIVAQKSGKYTFKVRAVREVNGKTIKGIFSQKVTKTFK